MTSGIFGGFMDRAREKAQQHESDRRMKIALGAHEHRSACRKANEAAARAAHAAGEHGMALQFAQEAEIDRIAEDDLLFAALERATSRRKF